MSSRTGIAHVGAALRMLRQQRELQQQDVARAAGMAKGMLSAFETGARRPSLASLERILAVLDASLLDLARAVERVEASGVEPNRETLRGAGGRGSAKPTP